MKEKIFKKGITRRLFSVVLALAMVVALMPLNSILVYAYEDQDICGTCGHSYEMHKVAVSCQEFPCGCKGFVPAASWSEAPVTIPYYGDYYYDTNKISQSGGKYICSEHGEVILDDGYAIPAFGIDCEAAGHWKKAHTHTWNYSLVGTDTIKAVCSGDDDCTVTNGQTDGISLTLTATSQNYSGISGLSEFNTATGRTGEDVISESNVKFYTVTTEGATTGGTGETSTAPTADGYYYASLTVGGVTAVKAFTIETPTVLTEEQVKAAAELAGVPLFYCEKYCTHLSYCSLGTRISNFTSLFNYLTSIGSGSSNFVSDTAPVYTWEFGSSYSLSVTLDENGKVTAATIVNGSDVYEASAPAGEVKTLDQFDVIVPEGETLPDGSTVVRPIVAGSTGADLLWGDWMVVNGDVTMNIYRLKTDKLNLILNGNLTIHGAIENVDTTFTVWATDSTYKLKLTGDNTPLIESGASGRDKFILNSGEFEAIADGKPLSADITVNGGKLTVNGGEGGKGLGCYLTVNGGEVVAIGYKGGEIDADSDSHWNIKGGTVEFIGTEQAVYAEPGASIAIGSYAQVETGDSKTSTLTKVTLGEGESWATKLSPESGAPKYIKISPKHVHEFTYSADGAVITATCGADGCTLTDNQVTLTISASDATYSGSPLEGQITKSAWSTAADGLATASDIYYISQDGTTYPESTTIPAVAGDFYARVYLIDGEGQRIKDSSSNDICAQVAFTIEQWSNPVLVSGVLYKFDVFNVTAYMGEYTCKTHGKVAEPNSGSTVKVGNFDACLAANHFKLNHTHTDHYGVTTTTSTNDTLTWYCSAEECTSGTSSTNPVKLTLTASSENYSGNTATITVGSSTEQTAWRAAGLIVPTTITYEKADGESLGEAPTTVGSYVAKVSPEGVAATAANTARVTFTILHDHGEDTSKYAYDGTNHWHPCLRIGCTDEGHKYGIAPHGSWKNGKCETCGYACKHNGAKSGICEICKKNLSSSKPAPSKKQAEPAKTSVEEREAVEAIKVVLPVSIDATQFAKVNSTVIPATAYNLSNLITTKGIVRGINTAIAASKLTGSKAVIIYTGKPFCFNREIIKAIQNGNKTVVYYFVHEGHLYSVTIPATVDANKVLERSGFAGPLYVGQQLGTTRLIR